jgi:simple sugar transport system substrate-binding protein
MGRRRHRQAEGKVPEDGAGRRPQNETYDDQQRAHAKTQELLRKYPNLKGFKGSASTDVAGIGLAIEERGLQNKTCVVGTSLP